MEQINDFSGLLQHIAANHSDSNCLNQVEGGRWRSYATEEMLREIRYLALGLTAAGLPKGACVGLMAFPSPRWTMINLAVILAGGVLVPFFPNVSDENFIFEIDQTGMHWIFVDRDLKSTIFEQRKGVFTHVIDLSRKPDPNYLTYEKLIQRGKVIDEQQPQRFQELMATMRPDDLASIIYTSGSTGTPKGVEHTQRSLLGHLHALPWEMKPESDKYLSILPLAHIFGFTVNFYMLAMGVSIYYSNDYKNLGKICQELHPTMICVVPRILEKIYNSMLSKVHEADLIKRQIGQWAFDLANLEEDNLFKHLVHPLVDKLVYSTLRNALGGSLRIVVSGGAPLNPHLNHFYQEIGINIAEGWGMTEACPITVNPEKVKIGTVGIPYKGCEVKISPEGEVLVRGTAVMRGYHRNPALTAQTIDQDGWLHTGDKGKFDEEGYLTIIGRIKELFKTSTGEYVAPVPIEQEICKVPLIESAMVVAEGRKFSSVLLFPSKEVIDSLKATHKMNHLSDSEFLDSDYVRKEMSKLFRELNKHLNHWEQIHAYRFVDHPASIEGGELTPTLKIRREAVGKKYYQLIDSMYLEGANV
ncbi:MAG: long-chain fatty acid--CoA ligase [Parachlamydia sp.]|nr:long-chain fatty acid--CoA ligase [Parachlamydia sp.]